MRKQSVVGAQGPPGTFSASPAPSFNPNFGQPTASSLPPTGVHAAGGHSAGGYAPSASSGFPSTAAPGSKGIQNYALNPSI